MQQKYVLGLRQQGFYRLAYTEWNAHNHKSTVVCVHGITRNSRDFDSLAQALQSDFRVICVDMPGRGKSDKLPGPEFYGFNEYYHDITALIARLDVDKVDFIGTSMGGGLGIGLASRANSPIHKLILNDSAPIYEASGTGGVLPFSGKIRKFDNLDEVDIYVRKIYAPMGFLTDANWRHLAEHSVIIDPEDGKYRLSYDPNIFFGPHTGVSHEARLEAWKRIQCPIYMLHGVESDIVSQRIVDEMLKGQPTMKVVDIPGVGHTPSLMDHDQIELIRGWLKE